MPEPLDIVEPTEEGIDAAWQALFAESAALHQLFLDRNHRLQAALVAGNGAEMISQMHAEAFAALGISQPENADYQF